ncbi:AlpA family phage regulatory protein [Klebsiella sp. T2.Ur]|nr:AlpA family phage regulatory protein [Klebsiella sp. T2.Ur]
MNRAVGKKELLTIVPLSLSTIYRLEKNGEFPKRWYITDGRCAWNAEEVERWLDERQAANQTGNIEQEDTWHSMILSSTPSKRK